MQRCNDCADKIIDTDSLCTACRMAEWRHFQDEQEAKRLKREALEQHRDAYLGRKKAMRDAIKAGVICAVTVLLLLAMIAAAKDALQYEWERKPELLRAQGVR